MMAQNAAIFSGIAGIWSDRQNDAKDHPTHIADSLEQKSFWDRNKMPTFPRKGR